MIVVSLKILSAVVSVFFLKYTQLIWDVITLFQPLVSFYLDLLKTFC